MISRTHNCVFIHIPKNAGQSVEHVFLNDLGLTWETRGELLLRKKTADEQGPDRLAHLTASEYVSYGYMTQEDFDASYRFAIVRNPWSRFVSLYRYLGLFQKGDFASFIRYAAKTPEWDRRFWMVRDQADYVCHESGERIVDYVGRFESIQEDFKVVADHLGLPSGSLPHVNIGRKKQATPWTNPVKLVGVLRARWLASRRVLSGPYTEWYTPETRGLIGRLYQRDVDMFEYDFE